MQNRRTFSLLFSVVPCLALLVVLLVLGGSSVRAQATTRYVAHGGDCGEASPCYAAIQAAVDDAADGDTIKVCQGVYTATGLTVVSIGKAITVTGGYTTADWSHSFPITQPTVIDAENAARRRGITVDVSAVATLTLQALTIQHGNAQDTSAGGGGILVVTGSLILEDSRLLCNRAVGDGRGSFGGGVYLAGGQHIVSNTVLQDNHAAAGGGLYLGGGRLLVDNTAFQENSAGTGGGLNAFGLTHLTVRECIFLDNSAEKGGGLSTFFFPDSVAYLYGNTFRNNHGGGAHVQYGYQTFYIREYVTVTKNTFQDNSGAQSGGGLHAAVSNLSLLDNVFVGNRSNGTGGGLSALGDYGVLQGNRFENNQAVSDGGGMDLYLHEDVELISNILTNNLSGHRGGGVRLGGSGNFLLRGNLVRGNTAATAGGGLAITSGNHKGTNDIIADNTSPFEGIFVVAEIGSASLSATHWTLARNGAYALTTDGGTATLTNTIVASHSVGGFAGLGIKVDHALFFNSGTPCSSGATCTNSFNGDPRFVNAAAGDYHIGLGSEAIDVGVDAGASEDVDSEPRPIGPGYDIGADEAGLLVSKQASPNPVLPGAPLTFTLWATNVSNIDLHAAITDVLPGHVTTTQPLVWAPQITAAGGFWTQTVVVTVEQGYVGWLTNVMEVTTEEGAMGEDEATVRAGWHTFLPLILRNEP